MPAGEFSLIETYFSDLDAGAGVALGVGDDCAILALPPGDRLAVSIDTQVEGSHFHPGAPADGVAYRAVAAAASDLAAMGARPLAMTLALTMPAADEAWLRDFARGLREVSADCCLPLVGGDTTAGPLSLTVQVMGALPASEGLLRSGARPGDTLCVSGTLGDASAALALLTGACPCLAQYEDFLFQRFYRPRPRLQLGRELLGVASAAIDISDGLLADAGHIAAASRVRIDIVSASLPLSAPLAACDRPEQVLRWALAGGDDYELCFCLPPGAALPAGCAVIGAVSEGEGVHLDVDIDTAPGYQHFGPGYGRGS